MQNKTNFSDKDNYINLISIKPIRFQGSKEEIETFYGILTNGKLLILFKMSLLRYKMVHTR